MTGGEEEIEGRCPETSLIDMIDKNVKMIKMIKMIHPGYGEPKATYKPVHL